MSSFVISQNGFIQPSPFAFLLAAEPSSAVAPELMRWINPLAALPCGLTPVTLSQASGDQYVRTSWKQGAASETSVPSIMETPFKVSFSVANGVGILGPFQSNELAIIDSEKSALGSQSVQFLCPWKPPAIAFFPRASSCQPISSSFLFPKRISRKTIVIFVTNSQSLSGSTTFEFLMISGKSLPALQSNPSGQFSLTHLIAFSYSSWSKISSLIRRRISVISTHSARMPKYFWNISALQ